MNVKETFLKLTSRTYPHGTEHLLFDILPQDLDMDEFGNLFTKIGDPDVMFTSHLDTATQAKCDVIHEFDGDMIKTQNSILGADDKAGVTIMLYMIEKKITGLYYFFLGEEVGCVGSKKVANLHTTKPLDYIKKVISFDRRGTKSVITFQGSKRCCSNEFAEAIAKGLNDAEVSFSYEKDPTGIYTDSNEFVKIYPECTNISVGYYSEHTYCERQDINHLTKLAEAACKVNWKGLPVKRKTTDIEYNYSSYGYDDWGYDTEYGYGYYGGREKSTYQPTIEKKSIWDTYFRKMINIEYDKKDNKIVKIDISTDRIEKEIRGIEELFEKLYLEYEKFTWDGKTLEVFYADKDKTDCNRIELSEYVPVLSEVFKIADGKIQNQRQVVDDIDWSEVY